MIVTGNGFARAAYRRGSVVFWRRRLRAAPREEVQNRRETVTMTDAEYGRKLDELDRLINDPEVPIQPDRVWSLLAEIATRERRTGASRRP